MQWVGLEFQEVFQLLLFWSKYGPQGCKYEPVYSQQSPAKNSASADTFRLFLNKPKIKVRTKNIKSIKIRAKYGASIAHFLVLLLVCLHKKNQKGAKFKKENWKVWKYHSIINQNIDFICINFIKTPFWTPLFLTLIAIVTTMDLFYHWSFIFKC